MGSLSVDSVEKLFIDIGEAVEPHRKTAFGLIFLLFVVGDIALTYYGLNEGYSEGNPVAKHIIDNYGWGGLTALKLGFMLFLYGWVSYLDSEESPVVGSLVLAGVAAISLVPIISWATTFLFVQPSPDLPKLQNRRDLPGSPPLFPLVDEKDRRV